MHKFRLVLSKFDWLIDETKIKYFEYLSFTSLWRQKCSKLRRNVETIESEKFNKQKC